MKPLLAPTRRPESLFARVVLLSLLALIAAMSAAEASPRLEAASATVAAR